MTTCSFGEQLQRIFSITQTNSKLGLASFLGIRQSSVTCALHRKEIPLVWLRTLMRRCNAHPAWILTGREPRYLSESSDYLSEFLVPLYGPPHLHDIPTRALVEELLRRLSLE